MSSSRHQSFVNEFVITYLLLILTSFYHNNSICCDEVNKSTKKCMKTLSNKKKQDHVDFECVATRISRYNRNRVHSKIILNFLISISFNGISYGPFCVRIDCFVNLSLLNLSSFHCLCLSIQSNFNLTPLNFFIRFS